MKKPLKDWPELLKPSEARTALGYADDKSVRQLADQGKIRCLRLPSRHRRYWAEDVRKLARGGS